MEDRGQSQGEVGVGVRKGFLEMTSKLRPTGRGATFLGRKAAYTFEYHRGNSGKVGNISPGHATGQ